MRCWAARFLNPHCLTWMNMCDHQAVWPGSWSWLANSSTWLPPPQSSRLDSPLKWKPGAVALPPPCTPLAGRITPEGQSEPSTQWLHLCEQSLYLFNLYAFRLCSRKDHQLLKVVDSRACRCNWIRLQCFQAPTIKMSELAYRLTALLALIMASTNYSILVDLFSCAISVSLFLDV